MWPAHIFVDNGILTYLVIIVCSIARNCERIWNEIGSRMSSLSRCRSKNALVSLWIVAHHRMHITEFEYFTVRHLREISPYQMAIQNYEVECSIECQLQASRNVPSRRLGWPVTATSYGRTTRSCQSHLFVELRCRKTPYRSTTLRIQWHDEASSQ